LAGLGAVDLEVMMAVVVACAIAGDSVGFELGKRAGPWLLGHRPLKGNGAVRRTMGMLEHYGGPAVFLGRFVTFARAIIPGLAGMSGLRYRTFLFYNALGGIIWGVGYTLLGYAVGLSFEHILKEVGLWSLAIVGGVVVVVVAVTVVLRRRERRRLATELADLDDPPGSIGTGPTGPTNGTGPDNGSDPPGQPEGEFTSRPGRTGPAARPDG
jgi:membrane protein DedA with SNARE-associated domain